MKIAIQDVGVWLPRTKTWLYNEISALRGDWTAPVIANRTENLSEFPYPNIYCLRDDVGTVRWSLEMALRRSGLTVHAPSILRYCEKQRADILHSHFGTVGWLNCRLASRLSVPHVVTFYGFDVTQVPRQKRWAERYRRMFGEVARVLCEGPHMASRVAELGCDPGKITVHRLGVRLDRLPHRLRDGKSATTRFLMAGSFREKKGFIDGLTSLGRFAEKRPNEKWSLTIVGGPGEHAEGNAIASKMAEISRTYKIDDRLTYLGFLSHREMIDVASHHDIFVCPSVTAEDGDTEGGAPIVMIEMAAMGLPILATRHCDMPFAIGAKNSKLLVEERDVDALLRSIEWLYDNPEGWAELGEDNLAYSRRNFDHIEQGNRLATIYDEVVGQA